MKREPTTVHPPEEEQAWRRLSAVHDDLALGEWLHDLMVEWCGLDDEAWAEEKVRAIAARLNAARAPAPPLEPVILWVAAISAFIGPGRYVYVTRGLLHRAWWEDAIAFVIGHEMAHSDLGHTRFFGGHWGWVRRLPGFFGVAVLLSAGEHWLNRPEHESAADGRGLDLCLSAGYDGPRCLEAFDVLEAYALDHGDVDGVFGPSHLAEELSPGLKGWMAGWQSWRWQHERGYPALRDRKEALVARFQARRITQGVHQCD